jgi:hypothetical protein
MTRVVSPEILDDLPPGDPRAVRSRSDLARVNRLMGHAGILARHCRRAFADGVPRTIVELGGGDGTFLLRLASQLGPTWRDVAVTLVDRQPLVSPSTIASAGKLGWLLKPVAADVFAWLEQPHGSCDLMFANLFLHHFDRPALQRLLTLVAGRSEHFTACEPRRGAWPLTAARALGLIGCNSVTRHDAVVSVRAGFSGQDLSRAWPASDSWKLSEGGAGMFSHFFSASRRG